ncbi:MAG TPA: hypothetical protein VFB29_14700 [Pseudolabrys sp.]|nr:hypothetical protein [Pseudolabrys sp.]
MNIAPLRQISLGLRHAHDGTSDQHHVAFAEPQRLASLVDRQQRRGTCRLNRETRAFEIELVRNAGTEEILVVVDVRCARCLAGKIRMVQLGQQVARDDAAAGRQDTDLSGTRRRIVTRGLERFPAHLKEQAMLRIHHCCVFGGVAEERRIEHLDVPQHRRSLHVIRVRDQGRVNSRRDELLIRKKRDGLDALTEILPVLLGRACSGKSTGQTNDRYV